MTTTASTAPAASAPLSRDETSRLFGQTIGLVALAAGVFAVGAYLGRDTSGGFAIVCFLAALAVLLGRAGVTGLGRQHARTHVPGAAASLAETRFEDGLSRSTAEPQRALSVKGA